MNLKQISSSVLILTVILSLLSCELEVPVAEMVRTKQQIAAAKEAGAEKYDQENLKKAEASQLSSHSKLKAEDTKEALKDAEEAYKLAKTATDTSWPLNAEDTIKEAAELLKEVDEMNGAVFASEEFSSSGESLKKAEELRDEQKFRDSYYAAREALSSGEKAKEISAAKIPSLRNSIEGLQAKVDSAAGSDLSDKAGNLYTEAGNDLKKASGALESGNLKAAAAALASAENRVMGAERETSRSALEKRIAAAEKKTAGLRSSDGDEHASDELTEAETHIAAAKSALSDKMNQASDSVVKAEKSLAAAAEAILRGEATEKLSNTEQLYDSISEKDTESSAVPDLKAAYSFIQTSSDHLSAERYRESIASSERAESILNSVSVTLDRAAAAAAAAAEAAEAAEAAAAADKTPAEEEIETGDDSPADLKDETPAPENTYVVQYRKKNTDCLWRIAAAQYKDARLWPLIYTANKEQIKDPDLIFPGQRLVIPPVPEKKPKEERAPKKTDKVKDETGDTVRDEENPEGA